MELYEIVKKISGPIEPIGETNTDEERFDNLREITGLTEKLIDEIIMVARHKHRSEHSMSRAGIEANDFIKMLRQTLGV